MNVILLIDVGTGNSWWHKGYFAEICPKNVYAIYYHSTDFLQLLVHSILLYPAAIDKYKIWYLKFGS